MNEYFILAKNRLKDRPVASVAPTWKFAIKKISKEIDFKSDIVIFEYGPGTGVITKRLLKQMTPGSRLLAVEKNIELFKILQKIKDSRLKIVQGDVREIEKIMLQAGFNRPNYVVSGIPFSLLTKPDRINLINSTKNLLIPDGKFILYQFRSLMKKYLLDCFGGNVKLFFEMINIPPLFIMVAKKSLSINKHV